MSAAVKHSDRQRRNRRRSKRTKMAFRPDIEGLRAVAVLFVLIWHAGVPWLPGGFVGVDVFFVISGFLMTSILHREQLATGRIKVMEFYARRARRLIPASLLTLAVTGLATLLVLPETRWRDIGFDIAAAGGYVVNWQLADRAVDYLARDAAPSPVQHFWSLSVEEQFYIVWPLLLVALAWVVLKTRGSANKLTFITLAVIAAASLAWSIYLTDADPGPAYFVTTTRLWELALGGLVAIAMPTMLKMPRALAVTLAWAGIAGIIATGLLLTTDVPFPGSVALIPTVSTALVIAAGPAAGSAGPVVLFANKPVQWIGGCSYSMYLWHWPVLVIGGYWLTQGLRDITLTEGVVLVALSVLPAWLSLRYVEDPVRMSRSLTESVRNSVSLAGLGIGASIAVGLIVAALIPPAPNSTYESRYVPPAGVEAEPVGAQVLGDDPRNSPAGEAVDSVPVMNPSPAQAVGDNPSVYANGCHLNFTEAVPHLCEYGVPDATTKVALIGDSHAAQWLPALQSIAADRKWKLIVSTKAACPYLDIELRPVDLNRPYDECVEWNNRITEFLTGPDKPAAVFLSYGENAARQSDLVAGARTRWAPLVAQGTRVVVIRDTPKPNTSQPECVAGHLDSLTACATPRDRALDNRDQSQPAAVAAVPGAQLVDLTDWVCPGTTCAPVIGGVIVFRDDSHMTATYAKSLEDQLDKQLAGMP
ncbi:acyltransferase family protein [Mycolicibacterium vaccae]|uniref:acyltransferase family protein n=1 Tax=Mycolicibacterium vaccae TaxID=1810 RepID=UPI003CFF44B3